MYPLFLCVFLIPGNYFLPATLEIIKMIRPITATTSNTPDHTPALNIPPIASQLLSMQTDNKIIK